MRGESKRTILDTDDSGTLNKGWRFVNAKPCVDRGAFRGVECNNAVVLAAALRLSDCETQLSHAARHTKRITIRCTVKFTNFVL